MSRIAYRDDDLIVAVKPVGVLSEDLPGGMPALLREEIGKMAQTQKIREDDR